VCYSRLVALKAALEGVRAVVVAFIRLLEEELGWPHDAGSELIAFFPSSSFSGLTDAAVKKRRTPQAEKYLRAVATVTTTTHKEQQRRFPVRFSRTVLALMMMFETMDNDFAFSETLISFSLHALLFSLSGLAAFKQLKYTQQSSNNNSFSLLVKLSTIPLSFHRRK
jgi:hypothetical protein